MQDIETPCGDLQEPGRALTVHLPDSGNDSNIVLGREGHDRTGGYIATVVVPLCPLVAIGWPTGRHLRRQHRVRAQERAKGTRLA